MISPPAAGSSPQHAPSLRSTCCYCGTGCGIEIRKDKYGTLSLRGDTDHPVSRGMLCTKGRTLLHVVNSTRQRLKYPQLRTSRDAPRCRASWNESIAHVAEKFQHIIHTHGPDAVGFYGSGQCLTEEYYLINKIAKGFLGTNNFDTNSRLCMSSAVTGYKLSLGADGPPTTIGDIDHCDTFFIAGANPAWCHPIIMRRIEQRKEAHPEAKIIVVDPRRTATCASADLHVQILPGTDVALFHGIAYLLLKNGDIDTTFLETHCRGWDTYSRAITPFTPQITAEICGIPEEHIHTAARWLGGNRRFLSLWTMGLNQSSHGTDKNLSLIALSLITGKIGVPGCGPFSLTGQPNAMGGREVGGMANLLSAHRDLANPEHRQQVAKFWGVKSVPDKPGLTATEMFSALRDGRMKAIWIIATNPICSMPDAWKVEESLRKAEYVVVQDIHATETAVFADVLLPAATWLEKTGTMTNADRRVSLLEKAVDAPGEALPDVEILLRFARAMGWQEQFAYDSPSDIFAEHARLTAGTDIDITGLSHYLLSRIGPVQWPFPAGSTAQDSQFRDRRLYTDHRFATADGKAVLHAVDYHAPAEVPDSTFPLVLTTGRIRDQWHTMTKTGQVARLREHIDSPFCEIHPDDAAARGIRDQDMVTVKTRRGEIQVPATLTSDIRQGVIFAPMHWGKRGSVADARVNNATHDTVDSRSKQPELKHSAASVAPLRHPRRRIVIIGAGAAAIAFARAHRKFNQTDEITMLSREPELVYNRVLLPMYIMGVYGWSDLLVAGANELNALAVRLLPGMEAQTLEPQQRRVKTRNGESIPYDALVLATGSEPTITWTGPLPANGVHTLRSRSNADAILREAAGGGAVAIIGGGILGVELAAALCDKGLAVTLVHRSARLLTRQLDDQAAVYLRCELESRGIVVKLNAHLAGIQGLERPQRIRLSTGEHIDVGMVVFATGIHPRIELARHSGLHCEVGIKVDEFMRTNIPDIYAIGECAEYQNAMVGTTDGAQAHAQALAEYLRGNSYAPCRIPVPAAVVKIPGFQLAAAGEVMPASAETDVITFDDPRRRLYQKCLIYQDRLVGVITVGDSSRFAEYHNLIQRGTELEHLRDTLLRPGATAGKQLSGRIICSCNQVDEQTIKDAGKINADPAAIAKSTKAGTSCGSCRPEIRRILAGLNP